MIVEIMNVQWYTNPSFENMCLRPLQKWLPQLFDDRQRILSYKTVQ